MNSPDHPAGGGYPQHLQHGAPQQYYQQPMQPPQAPPPAAAPAQQKPFLKSLFDLSFSSFITSRLVKVIYVVMILMAIGSGLSMAVSGAITAVGGLSEKKEPDLSSLYGGFPTRSRSNPFAPQLTERPTASASETQVNGFKVAGGIFMLLLSPLVTLFSIVFARVGMELIIVLFRIAEHVGEINHKTRPA